MKKLLVIFSLIMSLYQAKAQVGVPIILPTYADKNCCCCHCDTAKVQYKPINHWSDVKHSIYIGFNPSNQLSINMLTANDEQNRALMSMQNSAPSLYFGHEHIINHFFIGGDIGGMFGNTYKQVAPELNMRMTGALNIDLNLGYHLLTTPNLRVYAMGKLQFAYAGLRLQRQLATIPQKSWNRFISSQNELLPYDRLVEGFLTTDRWGNDIQLNSSFFATQLRIGMDYRIGKIKLGFHSGYAFQLSEKKRNWKYVYEFEEGDEHRSFQITDVPISYSLEGLNFGISVGYLFSDTIK